MKKYILYLACLFPTLISCDDFYRKILHQVHQNQFLAEKSDFESALNSCYSVAYDVNGFQKHFPVTII